MLTGHKRWLNPAQTRAQNAKNTFLLMVLSLHSDRIALHHSQFNLMLIYHSLGLWIHPFFWLAAPHKQKVWRVGVGLMCLRWYFLQEMAVKTPNIVPSFFAEPLFGSCRTLGRDVSEFAAAVFTLSELSTCSPPCAAQLLVLNTSLLCVWICGVRPSCGCNSAPLRGKSEVCQLLSSTGYW